MLGKLVEAGAVSWESASICVVRAESCDDFAELMRLGFGSDSVILLSTACDEHALLQRFGDLLHSPSNLASAINSRRDGLLRELESSLEFALFELSADGRLGLVLGHQPAIAYPLSSTAI